MDTEVTRAIVAVAMRQQNNVTRQQLLRAGLRPGAIHSRARRGVLYRVYPTIYSLGRPPQTHHEKASAAVLACGEGAALSHRSAMALWGLRKHWPASFEVITARHRRPKHIKVHRSRTLTRKDITRHFGIPVTTPARTLHDSAPNLSDAALTRAVNDALRSPYLTRSQLAEFLTRHPNRRLQPFVETTDGPTRSQFEDAFIAFCKNHALPRPKVNTIVAGREADAYFEAEKLIVELDGWEFHSSHESFESDRERDANALEHGIGTVRLTWDRLLETPGHEAARLHKILQGRRA
jgi:very-short-patch-repair endonuclease